jgi:hypothetical protein
MMKAAVPEAGMPEPATVAEPAHLEAASAAHHHPAAAAPKPAAAAEAAACVSRVDAEGESADSCRERKGQGRDLLRHG